MAGSPKRRARREAAARERLAAAEAVWTEWLERFRDDPAGFVRTIWGIEPWPYQVAVMEDVADPLVRQIAWRSGHGPGKTCCMAWVIIWFLATRYPAKALVTSATSSQLFDALHAEIALWVEADESGVLGELFDVQAEKMVLRGQPKAVFATFKTSRAEQPDALQGKHSPNTLVVVDESSGVPDEVFDAGSSSMSDLNATTVLTGNPLRRRGYFFRVFDELVEMGLWKAHHTSSEGCPNVNQDWVKSKEKEHGRESKYFRTRVLGEFPLADEDSFVPEPWVKSAQGREAQAVVGMTPEVWGLDVSGGGRNKSVLCRRSGYKCWEVRVIPHGVDPMELVEKVRREYEARLPSQRPVEVVVDGIGMGGPVGYRLQQLGLPVTVLNVQEIPTFADSKWANLGSELWGELYTWLESRLADLPDDRELRQQICQASEIVRLKGKSEIDKWGRSADAGGKKTGRKDRRKSPDKADALVLTFASDAGKALGVSGSATWDESEGMPMHNVFS